MIRSMTGFGDAECTIPEGQLRAEIKTVNHRFFNAQLRTPGALDRHAADIQNWLKAHFQRGHVSLSIGVELGGSGSESEMPELDLDRARRYRDLLTAMRDELDLSGDVDLASVARFGDLFRAPDSARQAIEFDPAVVRELVDEAAARAVEMREREGQRLAEDLLGRIEEISVQLDVVDGRAPHRLAEERERLSSAIRELTGREDIDEDRLAREIAYLSDKWDINEELVRFRAHLDAFRETMDAGAGPAGKRLGFLVQEMHREANTIGSKANDQTISAASVRIKEEIERLREQLENVE